MPKTTPENIEYLREHGPTPFDRLPGQFSQSDRLHGAARLKLASSTAGSTDQQGGMNTPVAYIYDDHDPERVVRVFLLANPHLLDNLSKQALVQRFGDVSNAMQDAAKTVVGETDARNPLIGNPHGGSGNDWTCPLCGEELRGHERPDHLLGHG